jgi:hypothetical protein
MIGRKAYFRYGNKVMAIEVYAETPEAFKERTGIDVIDHTVAQVASLVDYTGVVSEVRVGKSVEKLRYAEGIAEVITRPRLMMAQQDIDDAIARSTISLELKQITDIPDMPEHFKDYLTPSFYFDTDDRKAGKTSFVGFVEIPNENHFILNNLITLHSAAFSMPDKREFVSVHIFKSGTFEFDTEKDILAKGEWIVLIYGVDNYSLGKRFHTEQEANDFVRLGWKMELENDLLYYNS